MAPKGQAGRRGQAATPTTTTFPNGSAQINFQAGVPTQQVPPPQAPDSDTRQRRSRRQADPVEQSGAPLSPVREEIQEPGCNTNAPHVHHHNHPTPGSPSNPFAPAEPSSPSVAGQPDGFLNRPHTPRSQEGEDFPNPSPSSSMYATPAPRLRGTPRVGRHSISAARSRTATRDTPRRSTNKKTQKKRRGARDIWPFFEDVDDTRYCIFCKHEHSLNATHVVSAFSLDTGTSSLRHHLFAEHLELWVEGCDKFKISITAAAALPHVAQYRQSKGQSTASEPSARSGGRPADIPKFSNKAFVDGITEFIIANDQSLNVIECPQLRKVFLMLREELKDSDIPHRATIRRRIEEIWDEHLKGLEKELGDALGKISTTMDLWSDPNLSPFMAVTAHWIETKMKDTPDGPQFELRLRAELIGFHRVPGRHDGEHLAQAFLFIMDRISITHKLGWVTLDNATNNDTFMIALERELKARGMAFDRVGNRIRCFPHIVNLACKAVIDGFAKLNLADDIPRNEDDEDFEPPDNNNPIKALRDAIRNVRASSLRRQHFNDIAKTFGQSLQLLRDVDVRWSSTLYMIERALTLEKPLDTFLSSPEFEELRQYKLSELEWNALVIAREILSVPEAFQQALSAEKTPTLSNAILAFDAMIEIWKDQQLSWGEALSDVIQEGINKLDVYRERVLLTPAYTISMILNPTIKLENIPANDRDDAVALLRTILVPYYRKRTGPGSNPAGIPTPAPAHRHGHDYTPRRSRILGGYAARNSLAARRADDILGLSRSRQAPAGSLDAEIDQYLRDRSVGTSLIAFWEENQLRYPTLFLAALDYLAIQGSAVPCERVFSSAKETITDRRNNINESLMEMLQMLKFSLKAGRTLDFSVGTSRRDVIAYLEASTDDLNTVPEDINSFIHALLQNVH